MATAKKTGIVAKMKNAIAGMFSGDAEHKPPARAAAKKKPAQERREEGDQEGHDAGQEGCEVSSEGGREEGACQEGRGGEKGAGRAESRRLLTLVPCRRRLVWR